MYNTRKLFEKMIDVVFIYPYTVHMYKDEAECGERV